MAFDAGAIKGYITLDTRGWVRGVAMVNAGAGAMGVKMQWVGNTSRKMGQSFLMAVDSMQRLGAIALSVGATITSSIMGLGKSYMEFNKVMVDVTSVTKTTREEFGKMSDMVEQMSVRWGQPTTDMANAFLYLGRAGLTAQDQLKAFIPIVTASKAMMTGMEETAEGVINTMNAFGIQFKDTGHAVDVITKAVNESTQDLDDMLIALSYSAKPAAAMNNTLEELSSMLALVANQGIRGSKAGTALRFAFTALASPASRAKDLIRKLGLEIYDTNTGKMNPMIDILAQLEERLDGASERLKNMTLETLFGKRALPSMIALFDVGTESIRKFSDAMTDEVGAATLVANRQMRSLGAQVNVVNQQFHMLMRHLGSVLEPTFARMSNTIQKYLSHWTEWVDKNKELTNVMLKQGLALGVTLAKYGAIAIILPTLITTFSSLVTLIASPFGLIIAGLVGLQAAFDLSLSDIATKIEDWWKRLNDKVPLAKMLAFMGAPGLGFAATLALTKSPRAAVGVGGLIAGYKAGEWLKGHRLGITPKGLRITDIRPPQGAGGGGSLGNLPSSLDEFWQRFKGKGKEDIDWIVSYIQGKFKGLVSPELQKALNALQDFMKDIGKDFAQTDKGFWAYAQGLSEIEAKVNRLRDKFRNWRNEGALDPLSLTPFGGRTAWRVPVNAKDIRHPVFTIADRFRSEWEKSLDKTLDTFTSFSDALSEMSTNMINRWASAFDNLMQKGSSLKRFMEQMFDGIYQSFVQLISKLFAEKLFYKLFGAAAGVLSPNAEFSAAVQNWGSVFNKPLSGYGMQPVTPSTSMFNPTPISGGGDYTGGLSVPKVSINVVNKTIPITMKPTGKVAFDGQNYVVSVVMDAIKNNQDMRVAMQGGY